MRTSKLRLDLDGLTVDSFRTAPASGKGGTVNGHELYSEIHDTVYRETDASVIHDTVLRETEWISCGGTCATCPECWV